MTDDERDCTDPPSTFHLNLPGPIQVNGASSKRGFSILSPTYNLLYYLYMPLDYRKYLDVRYVLMHLSFQ